jgi:hypothetical protein
MSSGLTLSAQKSAVHLLIVSAGFVVSFLLLRNYFRLRLTHRQRYVQEADSRSEVSIRMLLVVTGILASSLGMCRFVLGELDSAALLSVIIGCLTGLLWWATAIWILGRRRYVFVTCVMFTVMLLLGLATSMPDKSGDGDELIVSGSFIMGLQLHLLLFLAMMRASQFRFVQIGVKTKDQIVSSADPLVLE